MKDLKEREIYIILRELPCYDEVSLQRLSQLFCETFESILFNPKLSGHDGGLERSAFDWTRLSEKKEISYIIYIILYCNNLLNSMQLKKTIWKLQLE